MMLGDAIDGLLDKISFDKFEALSSTKSNNDLLGMEGMLDVLGRYSSMIDDIQSMSRKIADNIITGLVIQKR
ncbi:MAG: hypothetical protein ACRC42_01980 [Mycoplasma sp.]